MGALAPGILFRVVEYAVGLPMTLAIVVLAVELAELVSHVFQVSAWSPFPAWPHPPVVLRL